MNGKRLAACSAALILTGANALALAQQPKPAAPPSAERPMDHRMMGERGMGGGDMMGMMNMMGECQGMMGGAGMGHGMTLQMPPGNEKLQFQMHAEMMQKMGEIMAKYAAMMK